MGYALCKFVALLGVLYMTLDLSMAYMVNKEQPQVVKSFLDTIKGSGNKVLVQLVIALAVTCVFSMLL